MANKLGRFEILSELAHSEAISIYKATDPEGGEVVVLKVLDLSGLGEQAPALVQTLMQEVEAAKVLNSHNLSVVHGAEEIDGKLCASLEYVQGNSIATMLARKEGFSIWDLQDIARQTCQGLDHAHTRKAFHYTLEPAKIMVTWDGTVKVLGFGISAMSAFAAQAKGRVPEVLHYMPPEQLGGDPLDARSNIFSLGAVLYEMVTEQKAFPGDGSDEVRQLILEASPVPPDEVNRKVNAALSALIMKALSKSPEERYQSGQELVNDLERCKDSPARTAPPAKNTQPARGLNVPGSAASASKSTIKSVVSTAAARPQPPAPKAPTAAESAASTSKLAAVSVETKASESPAPVAPKAAAVAAGSEKGSLDVANTKAGNVEISVKAETPDREELTLPVVAAGSASSATMSVAAPAVGPIVEPIKVGPPTTNPVKAGPKVETPKVEPPKVEPHKVEAAKVEAPKVEHPKLKVDPLMAEDAAPANGPKSFSDIDELPPLKEVYIAPPPPPPVEIETAPVLKAEANAPEKPKVQPRIVAKKAVAEIKKTPPKLFVYSIAAAIGIILLIVVGFVFHIRSENAEEEGTPAKVETPAPVAAVPVAEPQPPAVPAEETAEAPVVTEMPRGAVVAPKSSNKKKPEKALPAAVVIPGQLNIHSTPEGALITLDGQSDPSWTTPYNLGGLAPGQHVVQINKAGYSPEMRTIDVGAGSKSVLVVQLAAMTASVSVTSQPAGCEIVIDGKETGKLTPAQISVDKAGNHVIAVKKQGYLEEVTTANLQFGQVFHYSPTLKALGHTDDIKYKKMFGRGDTTGMGSVVVKTQPKGAQIAVNRRVIDKNSPTEFFLNPGTYVVDITQTGFKPVQRVINVERGGKVAVDEVMERE